MALVRRFNGWFPAIMIGVGLAALAYGLREVYEPAAWIAVGVVAVVAGFVLDVDRSDE